MRAALPVVICAMLASAPDGVAALLAFDRDAIIAAELWRCWTGHLVHFSASHAAADIATLALMGWIAERELGAAATAWAWLAGAPLLSLGLLVLVPDLQIYLGASGMAALLGTAAAAALWQRAPQARFMVGLLGAVMALKTLADASGAFPAGTSLPAGVAVAWQAHLLGAVLGALLAAWTQRIACSSRFARIPS